MSLNAPAVDFASLNLQEAMAVCAHLPQRLLLRRVISTPADRTARAKDKAFSYALFGVVPALLVLYLAHLAGAGWMPALSTAAATLCGCALWGYWRVVNDPAHLFALEEWIDFEQRTWQSRTSYADAGMATVVENTSLDALMLLCTNSIGANGWETHIGLCTRAEFAPDNQDWPASFDEVLSTDTVQAAHACAMTIARAWDIPCWQHSGAVDQCSERLC